jgi:excisionase family DNA binding protein
MKTMENNTTDKQVFTTGEAAKICNVSQQTIIRCFDSGRLHGFKVPGSRFRRIPREELVRFMQQNKMDMSQLGSSVIQVLVIGLSATETDYVIQNHAAGHKVNILHATDAWEAGFLANECSPELIIMSSEVNGIQKSSVNSTLTKQGGVEPMIVTVENTNSELSVTQQPSEPKEIIKQAVLQLLSA